MNHCLNNSYHNMSIDDIKAMNHDELVEAVIRLTNVKMVNCEDWIGSCLIPDQLADAFRGYGETND